MILKCNIKKNSLQLQDEKNLIFFGDFMNELEKITVMIPSTQPPNKKGNKLWGKLHENSFLLHLFCLLPYKYFQTIPNTEPKV